MSRIDLNRIALYVAVLLALALAGLFGFRLQLSPTGLTFEPSSPLTADSHGAAVPRQKAMMISRQR
jgi:hypothetical protein